MFVTPFSELAYCHVCGSTHTKVGRTVRAGAYVLIDGVGHVVSAHAPCMSYFSALALEITGHAFLDARSIKTPLLGVAA